MKISILTFRIPHKKNRGLLGVEIEIFNLDWKFQSRRAILNFLNLWALRVPRENTAQQEILDSQKFTPKIPRKCRRNTPRNTKNACFGLFFSRYFGGIFLGFQNLGPGLFFWGNSGSGHLGALYYSRSGRSQDRQRHERFLLVFLSIRRLGNSLHILGWFPF